MPLPPHHRRAAENADRFLRRLVDVWIIVTVAVLLAGLTLRPVVVYPGLLTMLPALLARLALLRGQPQAARYLIIGLTSVFVVLAPAWLGGVRTPALVCMAPLLFLCGWLLGRRAAVRLTLLFCSTILLYWWAENGHWLGFQATLRPAGAWMVTWVAVITLTGVMVCFLNQHYEVNFAQQAALQQQLQRALAEAQGLRDAMNTVQSYIFMKDRAGRYTYVNQHVSALFGRPVQDIVGALDEEFFGASVADGLRVNDRRVLDLGQRVELEEELVLAGSGERRQYWAVKSPIVDAAGNIIGLCGVATDITDMKRAQQALSAARQAAEAANQALLLAARFNETILLNSPLATGVYLADGQCVAANEAYAQLVGATRSELLAQNFHQIASWQRSGLLDSCMAALAQQRPQTREVQLRTTFGEDVFIECQLLPIDLNDGRHLLLQIVDLTARKQQEEELRHFAFHDALTQLPNRRLFLDRLQQAIQGSTLHGAYGAVLFLDLNQFKQLNDIHGHEAGDQLLIAVARRLQHATRAADTVARLGGDEFVVLLEGLDGTQAQAQSYVARVVQKIEQVLGEDYVLGTVRHRCTASIGTALFRGDGCDAEQVLSDADNAMYHAKREAEGEGTSS
ncbi:MAG: diguanylate cyclase domain-containing protein [Sphingomonadaceae bacterium]